VDRGEEMARNFEFVLFIRNGKKRLITTNDLNSKAYYNKAFKEYLYCPMNNCPARIVAAFKDTGPYFRTWTNDNHTEGCPYGVEYDEDINRRRSLNSDYKEWITDNHMKNVLNRAHEVSNKEGTGTKIDKDATRTYLDVKLAPLAQGTLVKDESNTTNKRARQIRIKKVDDLDNNDIDQIRCIVGTIDSITIKDDYGYINFKSENPKVKVHFNEAFVNSNRFAYNSFDLIKKYLQVEKDVVCCCIGEVKIAKTGFNIVPDRYQAFTINGLNYYQLINRSDKKSDSPQIR
jgi:hypothetical protein